MTVENIQIAPPVPPVAPGTGEAVLLPVPPAAKPQVQASELPPEALSARLEQAKNSARAALLAELGVTDVDSAKSAVALARTAAEAAKSDAQKLAEAQAALTRQTEALAVAVAQAQSGLTDEQKAAVTAIAGQDQALWLKTFGALAPTWGKPALPVVPVAAPAAPVAPAAPPVAPPPATTAPLAPNSPPSSTSPVNHRATYEALKQTNPFAAAGYLTSHPEAAKAT
jgi:hypothetical protein